MSEDTSDTKVELRDVLGEALDLTDSKFTYSNSVQLYFGANEVTLDMYYLGPNTTPNNTHVTAQRLARVVLPLSVAKEMAELVLANIAKWEAAFGITLPLEPDNLPESDEEAREDEDK